MHKTQPSPQIYEIYAYMSQSSPCYNLPRLPPISTITPPVYKAYNIVSIVKDVIVCNRLLTTYPEIGKTMGD